MIKRLIGLPLPKPNYTLIDTVSRSRAAIGAPAGARVSI